MNRVNAEKVVADLHRLDRRDILLSLVEDFDYRIIDKDDGIDETMFVSCTTKLTAEEVVVNLSEDERHDLLMHLAEDFDYRIIDKDDDDCTYFLSTGDTVMIGTGEISHGGTGWACHCEWSKTLHGEYCPEHGVKGREQELG